MKTKKILALGLAILMATSAFGVMSISAKDAFTPDDNLIIHWDFEGETSEEQWANKAPNGNASDVIEEVFGSTTGIYENGILTVGNESDTRCVFRNETNPGEAGAKATSLNTCVDEMTMSYVMAVDCEGDQAWRNPGSGYPTFVDFRGSNVVSQMMILQSAGGTQAKMTYRFNMSFATQEQLITITDYNVYTMTAKKDADTEIITYTVYLNGEEFYTEDVFAGEGATNHRVMSAYGAIWLMGGQAVYPAKDWGVHANYDDVKIYNKALSADEVAALYQTTKTPDVKDEAVVFEGVQFRNVTANTYDIRFVAKIAADNYTELGFDYDLAKWTGDGADKLTASYDAKCETAYRYLAYGDSYYDAGEGYYYISFTLEGIELTDAADYFEATLTAYGVTEEGTQYSDTYTMTAIDGANCIFTFVADN